MAKPIHVAKIKASMPAGKAASRVLAAKVENVREHAPSAMLGDVDGIHDMRVAVKRLREAMRLFRKLLPRRRRARMMPVVELLNDALGAVRERDVLTLDAEEFGREIEDDGGMLAAATGRWHTEREAAFSHLLEVWASMTSEGLFEALEELAKRTGKRGRRANRMDLQRFAYEAIRRALDRVHDRLGPALETEDPRPLHRLRIVVKRLRYSMEPFRDVLPLLKEPYRVISDAQELLGLTHDHDVLHAALAQSLDDVPEEDREAAAAVLALLQRRRDDRATEARRAVEVFRDPEFERALLDAAD